MHSQASKLYFMVISLIKKESLQLDLPYWSKLSSGVLQRTKARRQKALSLAFIAVWHYVYNPTSQAGSNHSRSVGWRNSTSQTREQLPHTQPDAVWPLLSAKRSPSHPTPQWGRARHHSLWTLTDIWFQKWIFPSSVCPKWDMQVFLYQLQIVCMYVYLHKGAHSRV